MMNYLTLSSLILSLITLISCSKNNIQEEDTDTPPPIENIPETSYDITQLSSSSLFEYTPIVKTIERQDYNELSGIAASRRNVGILYMHNDNKNSPILICDIQGNDLGKIIMDNQNTVNPEDIAVGTGPEAGKNYIYFADIGDNNTGRSSITVYRFEEPLIENPTASTEIHVSNVTRIVLKYPEKPFDAETLLIDPLTRDIMIATKETNRSTLFRAAYPQSETTATTLEPVLNMRSFDKFTSGDISPDGKEILLRNKSQIWHWSRNDGQSILNALLLPPQKAPYTGNEHQGEGIGFAEDGSGYFTNSETRDYPGVKSNLSFYLRKK